MDEVERSYWIAFSRVSRIGRVRVAQLEAHFGRLERAWTASSGELKAAGLDSGTVASCVVARESVHPEEELERLRKHSVQAFTWHDPEYPKQLQEVFDRPPVLYVRGTLTPADEWAVAVVGTRRVSVYGRQVAEELSRGLATNRVTVVSGLARGVDGEAHRGALEAGGTTVAVLGCGIDRDYPAAHAELARRVATKGLIVAEYAPGVEPAPWRFPARNRIVAGLCATTVVVEARERSGALITADLALEEGREVFAVPGEITSSLSAGTNALLKLGAAPLTSEADVLASFGIEPEEPEAGERSPLLELLPASADELVRSTGLGADEIARTLVELEIEGRVAVHDGVYRSTS